MIQGLDVSGASESSGRLTEEVFWFAKQVRRRTPYTVHGRDHFIHTQLPPTPPPQAKDRFRLNLLAAYPPLRGLLRSSLWPNDINFK